MSSAALAPARDESLRRRQLRAARGRATMLLAVVTAVFVVVTVLGGTHGGWGYLQATAEASMVGGVADWFAVTALFRRPLGLPIPHTAVIVERKDQFGETLGRFVQENFLNAPVLAERFRAADVAGRLAAWLGDPDHAARAAERAADVAVELADLLADEDVYDTLSQELERVVGALPLAWLAGRSLRMATAGGRYADVFEAAVSALDRFLDENRDVLRQRFRQETPGWVPELVDDALFDRLLRRMRRQLHEMASDPGHQYRGELETWLGDVIERLENSPELAARAEEMKSNLMSQVELREWSSAVWTELKALLRAQAADPGSELRARLATALRAAGQRLAGDDALRKTIDRAAESLVASLADQFQEDLAGLVSTTIGRWNAQDTADRLELLLGRDLQFIRINGTVVGALVGVGLHALAVSL